MKEFKFQHVPLNTYNVQTRMYMYEHRLHKNTFTFDKKLVKKFCFRPYTLKPLDPRVKLSKKKCMYSYLTFFTSTYFLNQHHQGFQKTNRHKKERKKKLESKTTTSLSFFKIVTCSSPTVL